MSLQSLKIYNLRAKQWPAFLVGFLSPPQLKNSSNDKKHCKKHCYLVVGLEKVVFREGKGNRKLQADRALDFARAIQRRN